MASTDSELAIRSQAFLVLSPDPTLSRGAHGRDMKLRLSYLQFVIVCSCQAKTVKVEKGLECDSLKLIAIVEFYEAVMNKYFAAMKIRQWLVKFVEEQSIGFFKCRNFQLLFEIWCDDECISMCMFVQVQVCTCYNLYTDWCYMLILNSRWSSNRILLLYATENGIV